MDPELIMFYSNIKFGYPIFAKNNRYQVPVSLQIDFNFDKFPYHCQA